MDKKVWMVLGTVALVFMGLSSAQAEEPGLSFGDTWPMGEVALKDVSGKMVKVDDVAGEKGTLVIFTCNHCPYVKAWDDRITALGNAYVEKGIGVVSINSNDPGVKGEDSFEEMVKRSKALGLNFPYVVDEGSKLALAFGAKKTPEIYLFDAERRLVYTGAVDDNSQDASKVTKTHLRDALEAVLAGKQPDPRATKALGCTIKFYKKK